MVSYNGEYKLTSSDNFDEYLRALGVGMFMRKAAGAATPVITVTVSGDHWQMKQVTTFKSMDIEFSIGVPQDITTADGRKVKSVVTKDADVLTEVQTGSGCETSLVREFSDEGLKMILTCGDVTCTRFYSRQ